MDVLGRGLHRLMFNLYYPAVLGAIFVSFIREDMAIFLGFEGDGLTVYPRLLFGGVFLVHWSAFFILYTREGEARSYNLAQFVGNLLLISAMYLAFASMPGYGDRPAQYTTFYFWVGAIGVIFLGEEIVDSYVRGEQPDRRFLAVDGSLAVVGIGVFLLSGWLVNPADKGVAYTVILILLVLSVLTFAIYYRDAVGG